MQNEHFKIIANITQAEIHYEDKSYVPYNIRVAFSFAPYIRVGFKRVVGAF